MISRISFWVALVVALLLATTEPGAAQTLNVQDDVVKVVTLPGTIATLTGRAELHVTGTGDPLAGSVVHLNSPDAWLFLDNIAASLVAATFLSRVRVNSVAAVLNTNVRVTQ